MISLLEIFNALYFMLPAYIANMTPVFAAKLGLFQGPIHEKSLGAHKTVGGLIIGVALGVVVGIMQMLIYDPYSTPYPFLASFLLAFGALFGDALKSFFKRRVGIAPGKPWIPFDQLDFIVGALVLVSLVFFPGWTAVLIIVLASAVLHVLSNIIGFWLGLRRQWI